MIHQDYFEHNMDDALFKTAGINGDATDKGSAGMGAELYSTCGTPCPDDQTCNVPANSLHYITRKHGEDMVHLLALIPDIINTRSEWFPLCLFSSINATTYNGLRIYFGKHSAADEIYPNRDAFVIELTKLDNGINRDAFDCTYAQCDTASLDLQVKRYLLKDQLKFLKNSDLKIQALKLFFKIHGVDNGELCPNNCSGVTLP
jgi:hypothetical protein